MNQSYSTETNRVVDPIKVIGRVERYQKKRSVRRCMCVILRGRKKAKGVQEKMNGNGGSKGSERSKEKLSELFSLSLSLFHRHRVLCPGSDTGAAGTRNTKAQRENH